MKVVTVEKCIFQGGAEIELSAKTCTYGKENFLFTLAEVFRRYPNMREELCTGLSKECQEAHSGDEGAGTYPLAKKGVGCPFYSEVASSYPTKREWYAYLSGAMSLHQEQEEEA